MSPIDGETAEPIELKFVVDTHGQPGSFLRLKKFELFFNKFLKVKTFFLFFPRATPGLSASIKYRLKGTML